MNPENTLDAAQRLLNRQYRIILRNRGPALAGETPKPLHDIRVAMRRFRVVIRGLRKRLPASEARQLERSMRRVFGQLGPIRDMQEWMVFLSGSRVAAACSKDKLWAGFFAGEQKENARRLRRLRRILNSADCKSMLRRMERFLAVELPGHVRGSKSEPFDEFAAGKIRRMYRRILEQEVPDNSDADGMHRLRCRCRKARYWAAFAAPALGPATAGLEKKLSAVARSLGDLHDMDVQLERASRRNHDWPKPLRKIVARNRRKALANFKKAWTSLHDRRFGGCLFRGLEARL